MATAPVFATVIFAFVGVIAFIVNGAAVFVRPTARPATEDVAEKFDIELAALLKTASLRPL
jgi:hypothetical protein